MAKNGENIDILLQKASSGAELATNFQHRTNPVKESQFISVNQSRKIDSMVTP